LGTGVIYELWCPSGFTKPAAEFLDKWPSGWEWDEESVLPAVKEAQKRYKELEGISWNEAKDSILHEFRTLVKPKKITRIDITTQVRSNPSVREEYFEGKWVIPRDDVDAHAKRVLTYAKYAVAAILLPLLAILALAIRSDRSNNTTTAERSHDRQNRVGADEKRHPGSGTLKCQNAYVVVGTARRDWSWAWMRQVLLASPEFRVVPRPSRAPGEVSFKVYDYDADHDVLVAQCDGDTCSDLAATYKSLVPSADPHSGCGSSPTYQGNGRAIKILGDDDSTTAPDAYDRIEICARLGVCLLKVQPLTQGDPGVECQSGKRKFDPACAQRKTCPEVVSCVQGTP
jgi:hypothetical protein